MAVRGPKPPVIELSGQEREQLSSWVRRRSSAAGLATRSRIVLAAAEGGSNTEIADRLELGRDTVARWRTRFARNRLDRTQPVFPMMPGTPERAGSERCRGWFTCS